VRPIGASAPADTMRVGLLLLATAQRALSAVDWAAYGGGARGSADRGRT